MARRPIRSSGGVVELALHGDIGVALIVFVASIVIPVAKFVAIAYLALAVGTKRRAGGHRHLVLYEVVEFIGRWSMIDVFVVAILSALVQLGFVASIHPGPAAVSFALSVAFTMLSAQSFDPRLIWRGPEDREPPMTNDPNSQSQPAEIVRSKAPRPIWSRLSVVWLVPFIALAVTLGIAWKSWADRGELIQIEFADATGIAPPGETALKFREIQVGQVESVGFTADLTKVIVSVRVDKDVAPWIDADASFWLVRPEVSAQGISNLGTVLSGTYIEGSWDATKGQAEDRFAGLDRAPIDTGRGDGTWVTLSTDDGGGLVEGAPVIFRGITVGADRQSTAGGWRHWCCRGRLH